MPERASGDGFTTVSATTVTLLTVSSSFDRMSIWLDTSAGSTATFYIEGSRNGRDWYQLGDSIERDASTSEVYENKSYIPHIRVLAHGNVTDAAVRVFIQWERARPPDR